MTTPKKQHELNSLVLVYQGPLLYEAKVLKTYNPSTKITKMHIKKTNEITSTNTMDTKFPNDLKNEFCYKVHYMGWKDKWDEWVSGDRVLEVNSESKLLMRSLKNEQREKQRLTSLELKKDANSNNNNNNNGVSSPLGNAVGGVNGSSNGAASTSFDDSGVGKSNGTSTTTASTTGKGVKRSGNASGGDVNPKRHQKESGSDIVKIKVPDEVKYMLIDDWEFITKDHRVVKLPCEVNVDLLLARFETYYEKEKEKEKKEIALDNMSELIGNVRLYFNKAIGSILLYRHERIQYKTTLTKYKGIDPSEIYGVQHLLRLLSILPNLVVSSGIDLQSRQLVKVFLEVFYEWIVVENYCKKINVDVDYDNCLPGY
ncbi:hypothetical protein CANARDRAFT_193965 [[Candida] arabinofermentans NRRL YB-2248]|uniref:Chromatin modification-related protein EAF3 n=1 Tax=[Candida] arabinofermentans NRRL YB-2248 TaxID=983967 RepID=A0A1E4T7J1_9ASCO|nr:hypothetical protein CANARDRAFT_193965 [[Candida] arabinofermentans NRRL YB-2248]